MPMRCLKLKKGFTLVELMGVIVILGVIALIAIPTIDKQLKKGKEDLSQAQIDNIKSAAELWVADNPNDMPQNGEECYLKYSTLVNSGYAEENLKEISSSTDIVDNKLKIKVNKDSTYNKYNYTVEFNNNGYTLSDTDKYCNSYTVTFDANGGNLSTDSKKVFYHSTYGDLPIPTRDGYTFLGWNGKNKFDSSLATGGNLTISNGVANQTNADTRTSLQWKIQSYNNSTYVETIRTITNSNLGTIVLNFTKSSNFNKIRFGLNGSARDTLITYGVSNLTDETIYTASFNVTNVTQGSISWNNIQLEEGSTATEYEPYYITSSTKVVQDHNHTLTAIWQANS